MLFGFDCSVMKFMTRQLGIGMIRMKRSGPRMEPCRQSVYGGWVVQDKDVSFNKG